MFQLRRQRTGGRVSIRLAFADPGCRRRDQTRAFRSFDDSICIDYRVLAEK